MHNKNQRDVLHEVLQRKERGQGLALRREEKRENSTSLGNTSPQPFVSRESLIIAKPRLFPGAEGLRCWPLNLLLLSLLPGTGLCRRLPRLFPGIELPFHHLTRWKQHFHRAPPQCPDPAPRIEVPSLHHRQQRSRSPSHTLHQRRHLPRVASHQGRPALLRRPRCGLRHVFRSAPSATLLAARARTGHGRGRGGALGAGPWGTEGTLASAGVRVPVGSPSAGCWEPVFGEAWWSCPFVSSSGFCDPHVSCRPGSGQPGLAGSSLGLLGGRLISMRDEGQGTWCRLGRLPGVTAVVVYKG